GHGRAALIPDLLVRFLRYQGLAVTYVRNVTDIDDKIIHRANEQGVDPAAFAERFTDEYHQDLADLGMLAPDIEPRVSGTIGPIVALIEALVARGLAYDLNGDVYYRVDSFPGYGKLSKRKLDELQAGARVEVDARKENPLDFALWKAAKPGEPRWPSPWGEGRPGWHIECSAMSMEHLGATFDIHTGGRDLIFPHHENEIAQSQGAHGEESFARYWVHNGFVNFAGEKMSKSLGNFFTIREVTALYHPEVIRYYLLGVHYRSPINFDVEVTCPKCQVLMPPQDQERGVCAACGHEAGREALRARVRFPGLEEVDDRLGYVYTTLDRARALIEATAADHGAELPEVIAGMLPAVEAAMADDLNTAAALAALSAPLAEVNRRLDLPAKKRKKQRAAVERFVADMGEVADILGVFGRDPAEFLADRRARKVARLGLDTAKVEALMAARAAARGERSWAEADRLRDEIASLGVIVNDGPEGSTWTV
ncbi:MAG: cysteine--tRNA ligase, partial [Nannocystaceae bacterium]